MEMSLYKFLPFEIVEMIMIMVHNLNIKDIKLELQHNTVRILEGGMFSFWVCTNNNRFSMLSEDEIWKKVNKRVNNNRPS
tara:strand:- start:115 stop:354 length:240 start_codon:yes stop_codon:yes gene_type:complete